MRPLAAPVIFQHMTYYGSKELASAFRTVRKNTIQIAEEIPEDKYNFQPAPGTRTVARTLAHIAFLPSFNRSMGNHTSFPADFDFAKFRAEMEAEEKKPRSKAEIVAWLRESGEDFARWVEGLNEDSLAQVFTFPAGAQPPTRARFEMIQSVKEHEMHHRAQLMLVERMLGITPHLTRQNEERMAAMQKAQQAQPAQA
ncbi:MAG: DinB family protein [Acidobacteriia bacterium]|nr:DinB family protein [Terriglobia bacterium]